MILSDVSIKEMLDDEELVIEPRPEVIQPASVDLHLSDQFIEFGWFGAQKPMAYKTFTLRPDDFVLGSTIEKVQLPDWMVARVEGKSSLGRLGLAVHITAGFIDPGFRGNITLELKNLNGNSIVLKEGMTICQLCFHQMTTASQRPYGSPGLGSRYQDSEGTLASKPEELKWKR